VHGPGPARPTVAELAQAGLAEGQDGDLGPGEEAVDQDQGQDDEDLGEDGSPSWAGILQ